MSFWKDLLANNLNLEELNFKGRKIARSYIIIQELAKQALTVYPNDIKFMFRYAHFLLKIVNDEYEAVEIFKKMQVVYEGKVSKKAAGGAKN